MALLLLGGAPAAACGGREVGGLPKGSPNGAGGTNGAAASSTGATDSIDDVDGGGNLPSGGHVASAGKPSRGGAGAGGTRNMGMGGAIAVGMAGMSTGTAGNPNGGKCPGNQILLPQETCACPVYAPIFCDKISKCINPLRDPDHCGDCDTVCGDTNACAAGKCTPDLETVVDNTGCSTLLANGPGKLYALFTTSGTLSSFTGLAANPLTFLAAGLQAGTAFAIDGASAYVATDTTLTRIALVNGSADTLVSEPEHIFDVAVSGGQVFYATGGGIKTVDAAAAAGTVGVSVAKSADEGRAQGVAVSGSMVLYVSNEAFNVEADPIVGDGHLKLGASQAGLLFGHRSVQADAANVYWPNFSIQAAPINGSDHSSTTVASPIDGSPVVAFAVDGAKQMAYLATQDGSLEKSAFNQGGEEATWVARQLPDVTSVVLDDKYVYVAGACKIFRAPR